MSPGLVGVLCSTTTISPSSRPTPVIESPANRAEAGALRVRDEAVLDVHELEAVVLADLWRYTRAHRAEQAVGEELFRGRDAAVVALGVPGFSQATDDSKHAGRGLQADGLGKLGHRGERLVALPVHAQGAQVAEVEGCCVHVGRLAGVRW